MKTTIKILILCLVVGGVLMLVGRAAGYKESGEGKTILVGANTEPFKNISVTGYSLDVKILPADNYGYEIKTNEDQRTTASAANGALTVFQEKEKEDGGFGFLFGKRGNKRDYVKIFAPAGFDCSSVNIKLASGDTNISNIVCKDVKLSAASGDVQIVNSAFNNAEINTASGDIWLDTVVLIRLISKSASGDFSAENLISKGADISAASGDIKLSGSPEGETNLKAVSGDITLTSELKADQYAKDATALSGSITVDGKSAKPYNDSPAGAPNKITAKTVSGDIKMQFAQ